MDRQRLLFWCRRLLGHLTTPLVIAALLTLLFRQSPLDLAGMILLIYLGWGSVALPLLFSRNDGPFPLRRYVAWGASVPAVLALGHLTASWIEASVEPAQIVGSIAFVATGAVAGVWYWLCVRWQPESGRRTTH